MVVEVVERGRLRNVRERCAEVKIEEFRVGEQREIVVDAKVVLLGLLQFLGRRHGVEILEVLGHVWCPAAGVSGHSGLHAGELQMAALAQSKGSVAVDGRDGAPMSEEGAE